MFNQRVTPLLVAIRQNLVPQMMQTLPNLSDFLKKELESYNIIKTAFITEIVNASELDLSGGRK